MLRILLIVLVFATLMSILSRLKLGLTMRKHDGLKPSATKMVKCVTCNLHLLSEDAVVEAGQYYCCLEHKRKFNEESRL